MGDNVFPEIKYLDYADLEGLTLKIFTTKTTSDFLITTYIWGQTLDKEKIYLLGEHSENISLAKHI